MKTFPIAVVVSTYRDRLLVPFDDYRAFLDYMVGEKVWLHDVAAARKVVAKHLDQRIPALKKTDPPPEKTDSGAGGRYIKGCAKTLDTAEVTLFPLPDGVFRTRSFAEATKALTR